MPNSPAPTVRPAVPFDPSSDAAILRKAMKGLGTDEDAIIRVLTKRTSQQRQEIVRVYQSNTGRDLMADLKSELSGKLEDAVLALMTPIPVYLVRELHGAMATVGTNERTLIEILCTLDNNSMRLLSDTYLREFGRPLCEDIHADTSGYFCTLLTSLCSASRHEADSDISVAADLAHKLHRAGEKKLGTDEEEFNRIMATYSFPVLREVFRVYEGIAGHSFEKALEAEFSGELLDALKALYHLVTEKAPLFFARELHSALKSVVVKHKAVIRLIVTRSECDLGAIKQEYLREFGETLEKAVADRTSSDHRKILLALIAE